MEMIEEKAVIIQSIERLKLTKPERWKLQCRTLLKRLSELDDPYAKHEDHGTDQRGRRIHRADCPAYEDLTEESDP